MYFQIILHDVILLFCVICRFFTVKWPFCLRFISTAVDLSKLCSMGISSEAFFIRRKFSSLSVPLVRLFFLWNGVISSFIVYIVYIRIFYRKFVLNVPDLFYAICASAISLTNKYVHNEIFYFWYLSRSQRGITTRLRSPISRCVWFILFHAFLWASYLKRAFFLMRTQWLIVCIFFLRMKCFFPYNILQRI